MNKFKKVIKLSACLFPFTCIISLYIMTALTTYSHGTPTPLSVLDSLWDNAIEGDEELLVFLGSILWSISWSYFISALVVIREITKVTLFPIVFIIVSFLTPFCAGFESYWRPYPITGNCIDALLCTIIYVVTWVYYYDKIIVPRVINLE
jgi:hypothetical protein